MFSVSVAVGQACTQAPHDTHVGLHERAAGAGGDRESKPRPSIVSANVPCTSSQARTQREQTMHFDGSNVKYGLRGVLRRVEVVLARVAVAHVAQADRAGHVLQLAVAVGGAREAVERVVGDVQLHDAAAQPLEPAASGC